MWDWIKEFFGFREGDYNLDDYEVLKDGMSQEERDEYLTLCGLDPTDPDNYDEC